MSTTTKIDPDQVRVMDIVSKLEINQRFAYQGDPIGYLEAHLIALKAENDELKERVDMAQEAAMGADA